MSDEKKRAPDRWDIAVAAEQEDIAHRNLLARLDMAPEELLEKYTNAVATAGLGDQPVVENIEALGAEILRRMRFAP